MFSLSWVSFKKIGCDIFIDTKMDLFSIISLTNCVHVQPRGSNSHIGFGWRHTYLQSQIFPTDWAFIYKPNPTSLSSCNVYTIYNQQNNHAYLQSQIFPIDWTFIYTPNPTSLSFEFLEQVSLKMTIGTSYSSWVILHLFFSSPLHVNQKEDANEIRSATMLYVATKTSDIVKCVAGWWPELVEANSDGATSNATAFVRAKNELDVEFVAISSVEMAGGDWTITSSISLFGGDKRGVAISVEVVAVWSPELEEATPFAWLCSFVSALAASHAVQTKDLVMNIWYCKIRIVQYFTFFPSTHHFLSCPTFHILMAWHYITTTGKLLLCGGNARAAK